MGGIGKKEEETGEDEAGWSDNLAKLESPEEGRGKYRK